MQHLFDLFSTEQTYLEVSLIELKGAYFWVDVNKVAL